MSDSSRAIEEAKSHEGVPGRRFLDPKVLARIDDLELIARFVVEGFISGLHRSPHLGFSTDFAEHRRALSAALPSRDLDDRVRKLTELVEELSIAGVPSGDAPAPGGAGSARASGGGSVDRELLKQLKTLVSRVDEVEASSIAGRDTLLARLERIMGTIDWRLQRLENPGAE